MINSWRAVFQQDFPFFVVQLAAYGGTDSTSADRDMDSVVRLRFDQLSALQLDRTGVAVAVDLGDDGKLPWTPPTARHGGIHPRNKTEVGRRLALSFAAVVAKANVVAEGPRPTRWVLRVGVWV
jgi:sialate O-acetylesterase